MQQVNIENKYLNATSHSGGVKTDMTILSKFVREELFYVFVHDFKNENDDCLSLACEEFIAYCLEEENKGLITNPHIQHASEREFKAYLRFLWKEGLKTNWKGKGNIRRDLSMRAFGPDSGRWWRPCSPACSAAPCPAAEGSCGHSRP